MACAISLFDSFLAQKATAVASVDTLSVAQVCALLHHNHLLTLAAVILAEGYAREQSSARVSVVRVLVARFSDYCTVLEGRSVSWSTSERLAYAAVEVIWSLCVVNRADSTTAGASTVS